MSVKIKSQHAFKALSHSKLIFPMPPNIITKISNPIWPLSSLETHFFAPHKNVCHLSEFQCFIKPKYMAPKRYPWLCRIVNDKFKINRRKKMFYTLIKVKVSSRNFFWRLENTVNYLNLTAFGAGGKFNKGKLRVYRVWTLGRQF